MPKISLLGQKLWPTCKGQSGGESEEGGPISSKTTISHFGSFRFSSISGPIYIDVGVGRNQYGGSLFIYIQYLDICIFRASLE